MLCFVRPRFGHPVISRKSKSMSGNIRKVYISGERSSTCICSSEPKPSDVKIVKRARLVGTKLVIARNTDTRTDWQNRDTSTHPESHFHVTNGQTLSQRSYSRHRCPITRSHNIRDDHAAHPSLRIEVTKPPAPTIHNSSCADTREPLNHNSNRHGTCPISTQTTTDPPADRIDATAF